jgi:hypothetical protein
VVGWQLALSPRPKSYGPWIYSPNGCYMYSKGQNVLQDDVYQFPGLARRWKVIGVVMDVLSKNKVAQSLQEKRR